MKRQATKVLLVLILFSGCKTNSQTKPLLISMNGVESIKLGMSKADVEKVVDSKLKLHISPDSLKRNQDTTSDFKFPCKDSHETLTCNYKGVELLLSFVKLRGCLETDFELGAISPVSKQPVLETKAGIKVGMSEDKFMEICKKNNYYFEYYDIDFPDSRGYFFSENSSKESSNMLFVNANGTITSLYVVKFLN